MKHYIKIMALFAFLFGISQEGRAQSPCFPNLPVTGAYANKPTSTSTSPNKDRVFWLTWGATYAESTTTHPYGKPGVRLNVGTKSYGSIAIGGGKYMCVVAEITGLDVYPGGLQQVDSYIPGTYQSGNKGDFLDVLYNIGGSGGTNNNPNNQMASGIIGRHVLKRIRINIKIKATIDEEPVRLRGIVVADGESLDNAGEWIYATGTGKWSVAEVLKNQGANQSYMMSKVTNASGTQTMRFEEGNDQRTGALAFLTFNNSSYDLQDGYAVDFYSEFRGSAKQAIAVGLLTSGYDLGDAPESYGKPIHMIDDISFTSDGIVEGGPIIDVNRFAYTPATVATETIRFLGSTAPDADFEDLYSEDAKGDDNSGPAGPNEEDAWPVKYRRFADAEYYKPGDKITATIRHQKGLVGDKISGWIDFDLNGTFDESERITAEVTNTGIFGSVTLEWTVPATRVAYNTYVRLRYFGKDEDATSPINTALHGEVEDHRIYILTPGMTNPMLPSKSKQGGQ